MKRVGLVLFVFLTSKSAIAALPPQYQNTKDLDVMVEYINKHPEIASTLKSIDFETYTIHFGNGCEAVFHRKSALKPHGWVGPAEPLEFKESICSDD